MALRTNNGNAAGERSRCDTCKYVHMQRGFRESEELVFCTYSSWDAPRPVPFKVRECTDYTDRDTPAWDVMQDIALIVDAKPTLKQAGFRRPKQGEPEPDTVEVEPVCE